MRALVLYPDCAHSMVSVRRRTVPGRALTGLAAGWVTHGVARCPAIGPANPYVLERHALERHTYPCLACQAETLVTVCVARCPWVGPAYPACSWDSRCGTETCAWQGPAAAAGTSYACSVPLPGACAGMPGRRAGLAASFPVGTPLGQPRAARASA